MLTVLEIVQQAVVDTGIQAPSSITSTTDPAQVQFRNILYAAARALRNEGRYHQQKRVHRFTAKAGRSRYPLPRDFYAMCGDTSYNRSESQRIEDVSDEQINSDRYEYQLTGTPYKMRISGPDFNSATGGGQFELEPTPAETGAVISFEYLISTLFLPPHWVASTAYTNSAPDRVNANGFIYSCSINGTSGTIAPNFYVDGDGVGIGRDNSVEWAYVPAHPAAATSLFNVGDYVNANSNIYKCTVAGLCSATAPSHTSGTATDGTVTWEFMSTPSAWAGGTSYTADSSYVSANSKFFRCITSGLSGPTSPNFTATVWGEKGATNAPIWTYQAGPYETINSTSDLCIFDDDLMVESVRWRIQRAKDKPYTQAPGSEESVSAVRAKSRAMSRFVGARRGSMTGRMGGPNHFVPRRNWYG